MRQVVLYIAASLDGYIAGPGDDLSFLSRVEDAGQDYGYGNFMDSVDSIILGRRTYDWVQRNAPGHTHGAKETYVITRTEKPSQGAVVFYAGDLKQLIQKLKAIEGKTIFIDGGSEIVHALLKEKLIDEIIISVIPVLLGEGITLFKNGRQEQGLELINCTSFPKGLVQLHYACK